MESKYYGEGKLKLTPQPLADLIGAQRVSVARWEIGMNEPKGAYFLDPQFPPVILRLSQL